MLPGMTAAMVGQSGNASPVNINSATCEQLVIDPANATATWSMNSSGTVTGTGLAAYTWRLAGVSSDYDVSFDGGATWLNLGTTRTISRTRTTIGQNSGTYDVRVRHAVSLAELDKATITLNAEVDA